MANPQKENGHIDIANEIAHALMLLKINGVQSRLLWVIWRKTYGWHKKQDKISISQFRLLTKLNYQLISRELRNLTKRRIIIVKGSLGKTKEYIFQKNYEEWKNYIPISRELVKQLYTNQSTTLYQSVDKLYTNQGSTKEIKETIQKKGKVGSFPLKPKPKNLRRMTDVLADLANSSQPT